MPDRQRHRNGLYRRLRQRGPLDIESEISGPALEGLVGQHMRAYSDFALPDTHLYYWRSLAGNEVDFVLYGGKTFAAVEVKNTKVVRPIDYNGLVSFGDDYPEASLVLLPSGSGRKQRKGNKLRAQSRGCLEVLRSCGPARPTILTSLTRLQDCKTERSDQTARLYNKQKRVPSRTLRSTPNTQRSTSFELMHCER